jgi:hypothetical protein
MKTECIIEMPGMSKFRFTPDMTWRVNDFFNLFFIELFLNKEVSKKEYFIAWMEAAPKVNAMPYELKKQFFDTYWTGSDKDLDVIIKTVYNKFHEQPAQAVTAKTISTQG